MLKVPNIKFFTRFREKTIVHHISVHFKMDSKIDSKIEKEGEKEKFQLAKPSHRFADIVVKERLVSLYAFLETKMDSELPDFKLKKHEDYGSASIEFGQDIDDATEMLIGISDYQFLSHGTKFVKLKLYDSYGGVSETLQVSSDQEVFDKLKELYSKLQKT